MAVDQAPLLPRVLFQIIPLFMRRPWIYLKYFHFFVLIPPLEAIMSNGHKCSQMNSLRPSADPPPCYTRLGFSVAITLNLQTHKFKNGGGNIHVKHYTMFFWAGSSERNNPRKPSYTCGEVISRGRHISGGINCLQTKSIKPADRLSKLSVSRSRAY